MLGEPHIRCEEESHDVCHKCHVYHEGNFLWELRGGSQYIFFVHQWVLHRSGIKTALLRMYAVAISRDKEDGEGISNIESSLNKNVDARKQAILAVKRAFRRGGQQE